MRIKKATPKLPSKSEKPNLKWQKGDFARIQEFRFHLPYGFLLLCKLWGLTPDDLLADFMDNVACGSWKRKGRDNAKMHLKSYISEMKYGLERYTECDIVQMFQELECIGSLWPENAKMKIIEMHGRWRNKYYDWWFKKWFKKYQYKSDLNSKKSPTRP